MAGCLRVGGNCWHPDVYGHVLAQSPSVWWEPPEALSGETAVYETDATWRAPLKAPFPLTFPILDKSTRQQLANMSYRGHIHNMLQTRVDSLTGKEVPPGKVEILLQAGTQETGTISANVGHEPLTQATIALARELAVPCLLHDGPHTPDAWAIGLAATLPSLHRPQAVAQHALAQTAGLELTQQFKERLLSARSAHAVEDGSEVAKVTPLSTAPKR